MENINWKMKGLAHGVDPYIAVNELKRLQSIHGVLTPSIIVNEAYNKTSPLHPIFEWDDDKAAFNYRLQQARVLLNNIQVTIVSDGEEKNISVYEVTTVSEGYKSIDTFTSDDIMFVRNNVKKQLINIKQKVVLYQEFEMVTDLIGQAIKII